MVAIHWLGILGIAVAVGTLGMTAGYIVACLCWTAKRTDEANERALAELLAQQVAEGTR